MGDQLYLFGAIPLSQPAFIDPGVSYSKASVAATSYTKLSISTTSYSKISTPSTSWTELEG
jgi:hypothetical protein